MTDANTKWVLGHKVTAYDTSGNYDLMLAETPPHAPGPPPHLHHAYEESFLVVEGEMEFMVNGEARRVKAGEFIDVPPRTLHTFRNPGDQPCRWVNVHSPKGFRAFFEKVGIPCQEEDAPAKSVAPAVIQQVLSTAGDFDMHIEG